ncbi:hypothetical protein P8935_02325 [Telmatobacter sp. DSM 110680]|uniref:Uncharacterized protein n=1 Tax=Telmatobacter sp. DSM 110680 TaxID=3036704 RepID=A0AAU7DLM3_9BACT
MAESKTYSIQDALQAQSALRAAAGLEPERFPVEAFVGMISDEIEALRTQGQSNEQIASLIRQSSAIDVTSGEIEANYAPPEQRHQNGH